MVARVPIMPKLRFFDAWTASSTAGVITSKMGTENCLRTGAVATLEAVLHAMTMSLAPRLKRNSILFMV